MAVSDKMIKAAKFTYLFDLEGGQSWKDKAKGVLQSGIDSAWTKFDASDESTWPEIGSKQYLLAYDSFKWTGKGIIRLQRFSESAIPKTHSDWVLVQYADLQDLIYKG